MRILYHPKKQLFTPINFGLLYNWWAISDARNIAAAGWHIPTYTENETLFTYLGGRSVAGGKLKATGYDWWNSPNTGATNESGFNLKGNGIRNPISGGFTSLKVLNMFMSSNEYSSTMQHSSGAANTSESVGGIYTQKTQGGNPRILKDSTTLSDGQTGTYTGNDGKVYRTICIGDQEWLADNLAETKYRNGDTIPEVTDNAAWAALTTGALCAYANDWNNV